MFIADCSLQSDDIGHHKGDTSTLLTHVEINHSKKDSSVPTNDGTIPNERPDFSPPPLPNKGGSPAVAPKYTDSPGLPPKKGVRVAGRYSR